MPGDIAYNTMRMWEGRSALVGLEGVVSPAYTVCKPKAESNSRFFSFYFKTPQLIKNFRKLSQGLVKDTLNLKYEAFSKITALVPSPAEQQKIAECLTSLGELIAAEGRKLDSLRAHKKGLMQNLFPREGETTPRLRFPEFRDAGEWPRATIGAESQTFNGGTPDTRNPEYYGGSIPFIRSAEIDSNKTELHLSAEGLKNSSAKMVEVGDVLLALYGANSGDCAVARTAGAINQAILCLRPKGSNLYLHFFLVARKEWIIANYLQGGQGNLSADIVKSIPYPLPHQDEQCRIADCLASLDALITAQTKKLDTLKLHKQGLMQGLFPSLDEVAA